MTMKTNIQKEGDAVIVSIEGQLNFETTDVFRESLMALEAETANRRVIFDLSRLQFVGSSGISAFVQTLREFNGRATTRPRYTNVRSEFRRIMAAFDDSGSFDFWDSTERALRSFDN